MGRHRRAEPGFRLLYVCTGNLCRSPFAEILTGHLLSARLGPEAVRFEVASAGVAAVVGSGMHPGAREELVPWGLGGAASREFRAQQLTAEMVAAADLVLGATVAHRSAVVRLAPQALAVTFSLREFFRLAASVDRARLPAESVPRARALVGEARARRGLAAGSPEDDQIADPISGGVLAQRQSAALIGEAVSAIVGVLASRT